jgi:glycosyltransferase involved in cell wall biosynthesis
VATFAVPGLAPLERINGVTVHRISSTMQRARFLYSTARPHATPFADPEAMRSLRALVDALRPDVVHAHNWLLHSFTPLKRANGPRLVVTLHDHSHICPRKTLLRGDDVCDGPALGKCIACAREQYGLLKGAVTVIGKRLARGLEHRAVDLYLPVSEDTALRDQLSANGLPFRVIPNFLSESILPVNGDKAIAAASETNPNTPTQHASDDDAASRLALERLPAADYIMFAGDVRRFKGAHVLIEAYRRLSNPPPLVLVGRMLEPDLQLPDGVIALGRVPHKTVMAIRARSLFAVAPSIGPEPFGIVIIEAMACGQPVIASKIGGIPDIIDDGKNGILVPPGEPEALRAAMQRLLDNPDDLQRMSTAARERARDFSAEAVVTRVEAAYRDVLQPRL